MIWQHWYFESHPGDTEQLRILNQGVEAWNQWRNENGILQINLSRANLSGVSLNNALLSFAALPEADLSGANLSDASLTMAILTGANLTRTDLTGADLKAADLTRAHVVGANLRGADLRGANLSRTLFVDTDLSGADLSGAVLVETNLVRSNLSKCRVHGLAARHVNLFKTSQLDLIISRQDEPTITLDNLYVSQFIYALLTYPEVRALIKNLTCKTALIFGRFSGVRQAILDALRIELRTRSYSPILFEVETPVKGDLTDTITTLARLAEFIIADISDLESIPPQLQAVVSGLPLIAVQPIIHQGNAENGIIESFGRSPWVLPVYKYETQDALLATLSAKVIQPVEQKARELRPAGDR